MNFPLSRRGKTHIYMLNIYIGLESVHIYSFPTHINIGEYIHGCMCVRLGGVPIINNNTNIIYDTITTNINQTNISTLSHIFSPFPGIPGIDIYHTHTHTTYMYILYIYSQYISGLFYTPLPLPIPSDRLS